MFSRKKSKKIKLLNRTLVMCESFVKAYGAGDFSWKEEKWYTKEKQSEPS